MCTERCYCKKGFSRDVDGVCVPKESCACGENEVFDATGCPDHTCEDYLDTLPCAPFAIKPACRCKTGFVRNSQWVCVDADVCLCHLEYTEPVVGTEFPEYP